jgi:hypothetical protein
MKPIVVEICEWSAFKCQDDAQWRYRRARHDGRDQYDSVIWANSHNANAQQHVREAGRIAVNAFLGGYMPPAPSEYSQNIFWGDLPIGNM